MAEGFTRRWAELIAAIKGDRSFGVTADLLDASSSTVKRWFDGESIPDISSVEKIAALRNQLPEQLMAELYDRAYAPTGDRTWPEIGATLTDPEFEDLVSGMPDDALLPRIAQLSTIAARRFQSRQNEP